MARVKFHGRCYDILTVDLTGSFCSDFQFCLVLQQGVIAVVTVQVSRLGPSLKLLKIKINKIKIAHLFITHSLASMNLHLSQQSMLYIGISHCPDRVS